MSELANNRTKSSLSVAFLQFLLYKYKIVKSSSFSLSEDTSQVRRKIAFYLKTTFSKILKENPELNDIVSSIKIKYNTVTIEFASNYSMWNTYARSRDFLCTLTSAVIAEDLKRVSEEVGYTWNQRARNTYGYVHSDSFLVWEPESNVSIGACVNTDFLATNTAMANDDVAELVGTGDFMFDDKALLNRQKHAFEGLKHVKATALRVLKTMKRIEDNSATSNGNANQHFLNPAFRATISDGYALTQQCGLGNLRELTPYTLDYRRLATILSGFKTLSLAHENVDLQAISLSDDNYALEMIFQAHSDGRNWSRLESSRLNADTFAAVVNQVETKYIELRKSLGVYEEEEVNE